MNPFNGLSPDEVDKFRQSMATMTAAVENMKYIQEHQEEFEKEVVVDALGLAIILLDRGTVSAQMYLELHSIVSDKSGEGG